jgi:ribosome modulation factor
MATKIRADRDVQGTSRKNARAKADAQFQATFKEHDENFPDAAPATKTIAANVATEADLRRYFVLIAAEERDYAKVRDKCRAEVKDAKATLDKLYADAADILKSRGISKRVLKSLFEISNRDEQELRDEMEATIWAMRAAGIPVGTQLTFWSNPIEDPTEAYNRAIRQGREAGLQGISTTENPHQGHQTFGQAWLEGWHAGQEELIRASQEPSQ